ncbi:agrin [Frankliniella occidentalis]|uniref:Agrin n=1 Tax=Frankliniella occidentalis TaxID=133901 RepID=A0A6J1T5P6_FRAOC|nr:agrin [Frankliniella occidentalis]
MLLHSAVLAAVLLRAAALTALCPCPSSSPPNSEDIPVCGSDGITYSSECELQCAGLPAGHSVAHPGPCAAPPEETVAGRHRRYAVEYDEWQQCFDERQCGEPHYGNCSECVAGGYEKCHEMCAWNCACGCSGLPTGAGLDEDSHDLFDECCEEKRCTNSKRWECEGNCGDHQFCVNLCHMEQVRCSCDCVQHALTSRTSAPTISASAAPATSSMWEALLSLVHAVLLRTANS